MRVAYVVGRGTMTVLKFSFIALLALSPFAIAQNPKVGINNSA